MAVYGCNDEYSFNLIDEETHTAAWDDYVAPMADSGKQFTTKVIDRLEGDWTATATIVARELAPDGESVISYNTQHQSKVTISKSAPGLPSTLTDDIYGLYHDDEAEDGGRSNVDMMFEELQMLTENFTQYRLEKHNRVLCSGL